MFQKVYTSLTKYHIWEIKNNRKIVEDKYVPYLRWLEEPKDPEHPELGLNVPEVISGDRFITIVNGLPVEDPNKSAILAEEAYAASHPQPTTNETLSTLCAVIDSVLLNETKSAPYYNYIRMRWYTRDITAERIATYVQKNRLSQAEADAIMAIEQVPLE